MDKLNPSDLIVNKFDKDSPVNIKFGIFLGYGLNEYSQKTKRMSRILLGKDIIQLPTETIEKYKG